MRLARGIRGRSLTTALVVLTGLLVTPAGCAAGGRSTDPPPSRAEFVRKADHICKAASTKFISAAVPIVRRGPKQGESQYQVELGIVHSLLIPMLVKEIRDLEDLGSPKGEEANFAGLLRGTGEALEEARKEPQTYIETGGHYVFGRIHYAVANRFADKLHLPDCPQRGGGV
jgi:hypothetical protein